MLVFFKFYLVPILLGRYIVYKLPDLPSLVWLEGWKGKGIGREYTHAHV